MVSVNPKNLIQISNLQIIKQKLLLKRLEVLQSAIAQRITWQNVLLELPTLVTDEIWFEKIILHKDILILNGAAMNNDVVSHFMNAVDDAQMFTDTKFNYTKRGEKKESDIIFFEVTTRIKM